MSGTIGELLELLDRQRSEMQPPRLPIPAADELSLAWAGLARSASRALRTLTGPGRHPVGTGTLAAVAALSDDQLLSRPLGAHWWLAPPATTLGAIADLLATAPIAARPVDATAATAVAAPITATLHDAADLSLEFLTRHRRPQPLTGHLQTLAATTQLNRRQAPTWSFLHEWRLTPPDEPGLSGAVHDWAHTALSHLDTHQAVTKLSLQVLSSDVALVCNAASAVVRAAAQAGALPVDEARAAHRALQTATTTWLEAGDWPDHLQLSGRTPEIRVASADLRASIAEHLRDGKDWKAAAALFAGWPLAEALADTRRLLHATAKVAAHLQAFYGRLMRGDTRVWVDQANVDLGRLPQLIAYAARGARWIPEPDGRALMRPTAINAQIATKTLDDAIALVDRTAEHQTPDRRTPATPRAASHVPSVVETPRLTPAPHPMPLATAPATRSAPRI